MVGGLEDVVRAIEDDQSVTGYVSLCKGRESAMAVRVAGGILMPY